MSIDVREATPEDMRFVHSSWHTSYWKLYARKSISGSVYKKEMDRLIDALVARSQVLVAFHETVPEEILGYSVIEGDACHAVYVKSPYRGVGIARGLVQGKAKWYTSETDIGGRQFAAAVGLEFNPFKRFA